MKPIVGAGLLAAFTALSAAGYGEDSADGQLAAELNVRGIFGDSAERIVAAVRRCGTEGLPADFLRARLQEGLAKEAPADALAAAVEARLKRMEEARALLGSAGYDDRREASHRDLLQSATRAMESGVPPAMVGRAAVEVPPDVDVHAQILAGRPGQREQQGLAGEMGRRALPGR